MWTVLRSFESEPEARVVEALLKAHHIDVQLLGTHSHPSAVAPGSLKTGAMRLMVRQEQKEQASKLLEDAESRAHLSVVNTDSPPAPLERSYARVIVIMILLGAAILSYLTWSR